MLCIVGITLPTCLILTLVTEPHLVQGCLLALKSINSVDDLKHQIVSFYP